MSGLGGSLPGYYHQVPPVLAAQVSHDVPQPSLYEVPPNRVADSFSDREAESADLETVGNGAEYQKPVCPALAPSEDSVEIGALPELAIPGRTLQQRAPLSLVFEVVSPKRPVWSCPWSDGGV